MFFCMFAYHFSTSGVMEGFTFLSADAKSVLRMDFDFDFMANIPKSLTAELEKLLIKNNIIIPNDVFNKILLDLEIMGKVSVTWLSKDARRG